MQDLLSPKWPQILQGLEYEILLHPSSSRENGQISISAMLAQFFKLNISSRRVISKFLENNEKIIGLKLCKNSRLTPEARI